MWKECYLTESLANKAPAVKVEAEKQIGDYQSKYNAVKEKNRKNVKSSNLFHFFSLKKRKIENKCIYMYRGYL